MAVTQGYGLRTQEIVEITSKAQHDRLSISFKSEINAEINAVREAKANKI